MQKLEIFLERLKSAQRQLIVSSADVSILPSDSTLRKIADLENSIAAVEALIHESKPAKPQKAR